MKWLVNSALTDYIYIFFLLREINCKKVLIVSFVINKRIYSDNNNNLESLISKVSSALLAAISWHVPQNRSFFVFDNSF